MSLESIGYADKTHKTSSAETPAAANEKVTASDLNELKTKGNAAITAVNTLLEVPANYLPGFPGGSALDLVTFVFAAIGTATPATTVPFYIITGQSNALGVGFVSDALANSQITALSPALLRTYANTDILYLGSTPASSTGTFQALQPPTAASGAGSTGNNMAAGDGAYTIGSATAPAFGQETALAYLRNRETPGSKLRVLKRTADGQPISAWPGTGGVRAKQIADFTHAKTLLPSGTAPAVELLVWIQGESDNGRSVAAYQADLAAELAAYREAGMIQTATRIVLVGSHVGGNTDTAKQNLVTADTSGKTYFISTTDLNTNDDVHYTAAAHLTLAERIWNTVYGTSITFLPADPGTPTTKSYRPGDVGLTLSGTFASVVGDDPGMWGTAAKYTATPGSYAEVTDSGSVVNFYGADTANFTQGFEVRIDGTLVDTFFQAQAPNGTSRVIYTHALSAGSHTVRFTYTGAAGIMVADLIEFS